MKRLFAVVMAMAIVVGVLAPVVLQADTASACTLGFSPGYWKNTRAHPWPARYSPGDNFDAVFGVTGNGDLTLLRALQTGGGGFAAVNRFAVASILNSESIPDALSEAYVRSWVQHAYQYPEDWEFWKDQLESYID
jgi:hypothetical protein